MTSSTNTDWVRRLVRLLDELRHGAEAARDRYREQLAMHHAEFDSHDRQMVVQTEESLQSLQTEFTAELEHARLDAERNVEKLEQMRSEQSDRLAQQRNEVVRAAKEDCEHVEVCSKDDLTANQRVLQRRHEELLERSQRAKADWAMLHSTLERQWQTYGVTLEDEERREAETVSVTRDDKTWSSTLLRQFDAARDQLTAEIGAVKHWIAARYLREPWWLAVGLGTFLVAAFALAAPTQRHAVLWPFASGVMAIVATFVGRFAARRSVQSALLDLAPRWYHELHVARATLAAAEAASQREVTAGSAELEREETRRLREAQATCHRVVQEANANFARAHRELEQKFQELTKQHELQWEDASNRVRARYVPQLRAQREFFERQRRILVEERDRRQARAEVLQQETLQALESRWREAMASFRDYTAQLPPPYTAGSQEATLHWVAKTDPPNAVPIGAYHLPPPPPDDLFMGDGQHVPLPALISFPHQPSLVMRAEGAGRDAAVRVLRNAAWQTLAAFPPGTVRLTIIDPMSLGESFSAFMHLCDFDERLVQHRIWTEPAQIQQRLTDLTEHMENVIQKYLRNEYASIQEYNQQAGEVAEPFRVLVVANFPHQFTEEAQRRLVQIMQAGPRCGVFTLLSIDTSQPTIRGVALDDLTHQAQVLQWHEDHFENHEPPFGGLRLTLDSPPSDPELVRAVRLVGEASQERRRVEVPFASVAPASGTWWQSSSADGLRIPLGRSGATQNLSLSLGSGTSQHVLIAGKTGSGKSTLLHALITNGALRYSPRELEFYLIDFKKGVEFKPYASHRLPHARVVAIESEREFGLSVLLRLDQELRRRGDLYRQTEVQSLAAFRRRRPEETLPRIILIIDEFQEFFVRDDRVAHDATLLLDRLVRQGRAFGMHVVLGSQTLSGAYTLARSTIGQMAVRIALECSAADANVIFSEENTAARLLGRPGEAIYNDTNGSIEGNHPFQVVWLPDEERNDYLLRLKQLAERESFGDRVPIVFEGHAAADLRANRELSRRLQSSDIAKSPTIDRCWLGETLEIKDPLSLTFPQQMGSHLLVVGPQRDEALAMVFTSCVGLLSNEPRRELTTPMGTELRTQQPKCTVVLDLDECADSTADAMRSVPRAWPHACRIWSLREVEEAVTMVSDLVSQRMADPTTAHASHYLFLHDITRMRGLQAGDDEFALGRFSRSETTKSASAKLQQILRDGPGVGIHVIVWADAYHALSRWFDRSTLREFGQRVLMQMSAADSSHLIDSIAASQLGAHRALYYDQDRGTLEKFRPYGLPDLSWWLELIGCHTPISLGTSNLPDSRTSDSLTTDCGL